MTYPVPDVDGPIVWTPPLFPRQTWLGRNHDFVLEDYYRYRWIVEGVIHQLTVEAGFHHDMSTVPRVVWPLISPMDLSAACVPHDYLYNWRGLLPPDAHQIWIPGQGWQDALRGLDGSRLAWSRRDADRLFARHMREAGVPKWRRRAAYRAVRLAGRGAWARGSQTHDGLPKGY